MKISTRYAAGSDVGLNRENNEDSAYAGRRLCALADGMGGHVGGEIASATVIEAVRSADAEVPVADLAGALGRAVEQASESLRQVVEARPELASMGTTLTALLWSDRHVAVAHIGDSRGYRLRDGELTRLTEDHTMEQLLGVDRFRHVLTRSLDGRSGHEPDLTVFEVQPSDRYLLCSDGLTDVVDDEVISEVLGAVAEPAETVGRLIELALAGGGPDNVTCIVADVVDDAATSEPILVGAASGD